jgi:hypothetical protein
LTDDFDVAWDTFGRGLDRDAAEDMASRFVLQSEASWTDVSTAPDRQHPTTYMIATEETGPSVTAGVWSKKADHVMRLPGAHLLMLNRADEVAEALARI